jgi:hypothetical protein
VSPVENRGGRAVDSVLGALAMSGLALNPASIPGLIAWYDASALTGLADGDPVLAFTDLSGYGRTLGQPTSSMRPTFKTAFMNGKHAVRFDGVDDQLESGSYAHPSIFTSFSAVRVEDLADHRTIVGGASGSPHYRVNTAGAVDLAKGGLAGVGTSSGLVGLGRTAVLTVQHDATSGAWAMYLDGTLIGSGTTALAYSGALTVRMGGVSSQFMKGPIGELLIYDSVLGAVNRQAVEAYLTSKWGGAIVAYDDFNRADGAPGVAPSGQTWLTPSPFADGKPQIVGNKVAGFRPFYGNNLVMDTGKSDGTVSCTLSGTSQNGSLIFRYVDENNYWACQNGSLAKRVAGADTNLSGIGTDPNAMIRFNGPTIEYFRFGAKETYTDSTFQSATKHGIQLGSTDVFGDNFQFRSLT